MSTSLLYHAFGVRGYDYGKTEYIGGDVVFHIQPKRLRCSQCGSSDVTKRGSVNRLFRSLSIGLKHSWIEMDVPRVQCRACKSVRQVKIDFSNPKRRHTKAFARFALELSQLTTIQDAALFLGVSWDTIKEIQKSDLGRRYCRIRLRDLKRIAIDEICIGSGYGYLTIVLDLESGAIVFVGRGKSAAALKPFWKRLKASHANVEAVAIDMSTAYIKAVSQALPDAAIIFDRFHIVKLLNDCLTKLRRQLYREAKDVLQKEVLKGTRWLLLKHPDNLDEERDEPARLAEAFELNSSLMTAYQLKEDLRQLWEQPHKTAARNFLTSWYLRAMASGIGVMQKFARTLAAHSYGILTWYDHPISTGPLEGTNNKIKTMNRQAYGFRDREFFILKLYALHQTRFALIG